MLKSLFSRNNAEAAVAESSKKMTPRNRGPSVVARLMGLDTLPEPTHPKKSAEKVLVDVNGRNSSKSNTKSKPKSLDEQKHSKLRNCDSKINVKDDSTMLTSTGAESIRQYDRLEEFNRELLKHMQLLDELEYADFEGGKQVPMSMFSGSSEFLDAVDLLQTNRDFFVKYFRQNGDELEKGKQQGKLRVKDKKMNQRTSLRSYLKQDRDIVEGGDMVIVKKTNLSELKPLMSASCSPHSYSRLKENVSSSDSIIKKNLQKKTSKEYSKDIAKLIVKKIKESISKEVAKKLHYSKHHADDSSSSPRNFSPKVSPNSTASTSSPSRRSQKSPAPPSPSQQPQHQPKKKDFLAQDMSPALPIPVTSKSSTTADSSIMNRNKSETTVLEMPEERSSTAATSDSPERTSHSENCSGVSATSISSNTYETPGTPEGKAKKAQHLSPVSVLDFGDDDPDPDDAKEPISQALTGGKWMGSEDDELAYVRKLTIHVEKKGVMDPLLLEKLEEDYLYCNYSIGEEAENDKLHVGALQRWRLFDLTNEMLPRCQIERIGLAERVWREICELRSCSSTDDLAILREWSEKERVSVDDVLLEIESFILNDMVEDAFGIFS